MTKNVIEYFQVQDDLRVAVMKLRHGYKTFTGNFTSIGLLESCVKSSCENKITIHISLALIICTVITYSHLHIIWQQLCAWQMTSTASDSWPSAINILLHHQLISWRAINILLLWRADSQKGSKNMSMSK